MKIIRFYSHPDGVFPPLEPGDRQLPRQYMPIRDRSVPLDGKREVVEVPDDFWDKHVVWPYLDT